MPVEHLWVGAVTHDSAWVRGKVTAATDVRLAVADNASLTTPVFYGPVTPDGTDMASILAEDLDPDTRYWFAFEVDDDIDQDWTGRFRTHAPPGVSFSFTFAASSCAGLDNQGISGAVVEDRVSNHPVFDTIRAWDPLFMAHLGDLHYRDIDTANSELFRDAYDDVLTFNDTEGADARQGRLYREVPIAYVWDDHDYGPNDSDSSAPGRDNACEVFRERVPHYPLGATGSTDPVYQSWQVGRVLFIASDTRADRDPNASPPTMLGEEQKAWLDGVLSTSTAEVFVWLMPTPWIGLSSDTWAGFPEERQELVDMLGARGWLDRMIMINGDKHAIAIESGHGGNADHGRFPIFLFASLDSDHGATTTQYDLGMSTGRGRYGLVQVRDLGTLIELRGTAYIGGNAWADYTHTVPVPVPVSGTLVNALSGSHRATFDARVITAFQTGPDPDGTEIPILDGTVTIDGTAEIRGTLELTTLGEWPRRGDSLLAPYGNEIFVRRGVDLGGAGIDWVPLGYYRIDSVEQSDAPDGPLSISGTDRMSTIQDSRLLQPRSYQPGIMIQQVIDDLVSEIYPDAVILFDDDSDTATLGRQLIVEESRFDALQDLARSLGKLAYWDTEGSLRIEDAPEPDDIVWRVSARHDGVLVDGKRRITREGVYNAVVARGEAATDASPVEGVARDMDPLSPTRFGGRFGKVPRFYASPAVSDEGQARRAARRILRRAVGMPYSVDFSAIVNPTLRPGEHVVIVQSDGTRETHAIESVTIPLSADRPMSGTTRDQTHLRKR